MQGIIKNKSNNTINILQEKKQDETKKNYPVRDFLIANSRLLKINSKEAEGKILAKCEEEKRRIIYDFRDKAFRKIRDEIAKFYEKAANGDYFYDGMPEIRPGVRGWIEGKIWRLLVEIAEPGHLRYEDADDNFWVGA